MDAMNLNLVRLSRYDDEADTIVNENFILAGDKIIDVMIALDEDIGDENIVTVEITPLPCGALYLSDDLAVKAKALTELDVLA